MEDLQNQILGYMDKNETIANSESWALEHKLDHALVVNAIKSLVAFGLISSNVLTHTSFKVTAEAEDYVAHGSPEAQVFNAIPEEGISMKDLEKKVGKISKFGFSQGMKLKWFMLDKQAGLIKKKVSSIEDVVGEQLKNPGSLAPKDLDALKKRKFIVQEVKKSFELVKTDKFQPQLVKKATDLTMEMLQSGSWKTEALKEYNLNAMGLAPQGGHLHPLMKVRSQFREIFLEMGFEEMPTDQYVESSFWNFDSLFQPQQHPARDMHDTFFTKDPAVTMDIPKDYLEVVKQQHEVGGFGSIGHRYDWKEDEARKNLLRTHTTAVSARVLYQIAKAQDFRPRKFFSIDRVFRNETLDATHLAEFHQIEGMVIGTGLTLGNLIGTLSTFFGKMGMTDLKFKPAYNPYTEPSMEIFAYHPGLKKWIEIGNSGVFRPEMLRPMGFPEDFRVIAWGLSLERPTMIQYGYSNIRDLVGHKVDLEMIQSNPICDLTIAS
eukprot:GCRY01002879.1.p1 GENE.GCRY01002879.1~~GCRY01002879.1.p1  ORF type:complete len:491 (-),score=112.82 GCRY01002879.1:22-1494(-)